MFGDTKDSDLSQQVKPPGHPEEQLRHLCHGQHKRLGSLPHPEAPQDFFPFGHLELGHLSHQPPLTTCETIPPLMMLSFHHLLAHLAHLVTPSVHTSTMSSSQVLIHGLVTSLGHSPKRTAWWQTDGPGLMLEVKCGVSWVRSGVGCVGLQVWDVLGQGRCGIFWFLPPFSWCCRTR